MSKMTKKSLYFTHYELSKSTMYASMDTQQPHNQIVLLERCD